MARYGRGGYGLVGHCVVWYDAILVFICVWRLTGCDLVGAGWWLEGSGSWVVGGIVLVPVLLFVLVFKLLLLLLLLSSSSSSLLLLLGAYTMRRARACARVSVWPREFP